MKAGNGRDSWLQTLVTPSRFQGPSLQTFPVWWPPIIQSALVGLEYWKHSVGKSAYFNSRRNLGLECPEEPEPLEVGDVSKLLVQSRQEV